MPIPSRIVSTNAHPQPIHTHWISSKWSLQVYWYVQWVLLLIALSWLCLPWLLLSISPFHTFWNCRVNLINTHNFASDFGAGTLMDKGLCPDTSSKRLQVAASAALDDMMTGWLDFYQCPLIVYDFLHFLYFSSICIDSVCVCVSLVRSSRLPQALFFSVKMTLTDFLVTWGFILRTWRILLGTLDDLRRHFLCGPFHQCTG